MIAMSQIQEEEPNSLEAQPELEATLTTEIRLLWSTHRNSSAAARQTRAQLKVVRSGLGEKLYTIKSILAQTGRGGRWADYLRSLQLPRATADRYVSQHDNLLHPRPTNSPSEAITKPTEAEVRRFAQMLLPRLSRTITTPSAFFWFTNELFQELPSDGRATAHCVEVLRPTTSGLQAVASQMDHDRKRPRCVGRDWRIEFTCIYRRLQDGIICNRVVVTNTTLSAYFKVLGFRKRKRRFCVRFRAIAIIEVLLSRMARDRTARVGKLVGCPLWQLGQPSILCAHSNSRAFQARILNKWENGKRIA